MKEFVYFLFLVLSINLDCFASSVTEGFLLKTRNYKKFFQIGAVFGLAQAGCFLLGFLFGRFAANWITSIDHWVAFFILLLVGMHMIFEEFSQKKEVEGFSNSFKTLMGVAIAVSIDALAIGLVTSILLKRLALLAILVFLLTFLISFTGVAIGARFSRLTVKIRHSQSFGGMILILIGFKILFEHLGIF